MRKVLLDTSIILDDTNNLVYLHKQGNELFLSDIVLEELDRKKDSLSESGYFAREFFRCVSEDSKNTESNFNAINIESNGLDSKKQDSINDKLQNLNFSNADSKDSTKQDSINYKNIESSHDTNQDSINNKLQNLHFKNTDSKDSIKVTESNLQDSNKKLNLDSTNDKLQNLHFKNTDSKDSIKNQITESNNLQNLDSKDSTKQDSINDKNTESNSQNLDSINNQNIESNHATNQDSINYKNIESNNLQNLVSKDFTKQDSTNDKNIESNLQDSTNNQNIESNHADSKDSTNHKTTESNLANLDSKAILTPKQDDFIATLQFKTQSNAIPLHIITRKKYKTQSSDYGYNDARIREIAKDYNLRLLTNDIALKVRSISEGIESKSLKNGQISNPKEIEFISKITLRRDLSDKAEFEQSGEFKAKSNWHVFEIAECDYTDSARYLTGKKYFGFKLNDSLEILDLDSIIKEQKPYILPINIEQKLAYALLTHPQNYLSIITGSTGSGKTLMALLAGLSLQKLGKVDGIIYLRNTITANDKEAELGFRKGDESQKLHYFMYPLFSSINFIIESLKEHSEAKRIEYKGESKGFDKQEATYYFLQKHNIEMLDIAHARGISLHNKFVIFDEVQNASNATIKLIGTRIGENSRIVFLGDYNQIDHPYLSKTRNGAISMLNKAITEDFVFGLQFKHTIRSTLASWFDEKF